MDKNINIKNIKDIEINLDEKYALRYIKVKNNNEIDKKKPKINLFSFNNKDN